MPARTRRKAVRTSIRFGTYLTAAIVFLACSVAAEPLPSLCHNGWPVKRKPDCTVSNVPGCISYGGLPKRRGFARNHHLPLCLGGSDTADNIEYEPLREAHEQDIKVEWKACEDYCAGRITLDEARRQFR